ncbi:MAG: Crp/Fnr family transcriptional regulator [Actinomycetota bacterium]
MTGNRLLDALGREDFDRITSKAQVVDMPLGTVAFEPNAEIVAVHFPINGVLSLVTTTSDGSTIEVSTLGNEGTTGVPIFLGSTFESNTRCISQVEGQSLRIDARAFRDECEGSRGLQKLMQRYTKALLTQVGQAVACSRLHSTRQRCARWLLMTDDRAGKEEFILTQDFLAYMLGVRRASVTTAIGPFRDDGIVAYSRGRLKILDRASLKQAACECYDIMQRAFDSVFQAP